MPYLALDTSTEYLSLALTTPGGIVARQWHVGQRHAERTLPELETLLAETGIARGELEGIAYGMGPGSFTGLRIGCGIAQGLAFGLGVKLVGISTLAALAAGCDAPRVYACLDARMNQVYAAAFEQVNGDWREVTAAVVSDPQAVPLPEGEGWIGVGSGFAAHGDALAQRLGAQLGTMLPDHFPQARDLLRLALPVFERGDALAPEDAPLVYLRDKVALKTSERLKP
ncbi:tRNA (adenosine(37)-N6)-threonylcarbamoyltransferase complex dimerization subunit type 1 TsaB [Chitiniphilus eburneus]|uniref:tRNA (Adenosine(37)-N6)-threonylcarbamoyltransferase complex dimerization subunit type 1 TsaB n=1 Tax=Chitiniphilus eburneus TaxID=2571148 RepID=A0A4U0QDZ1_9NEIS|nr:tRNA (adenosine(37)-N6)-threonylcarbamoyltransferase complex dimerization subunit type 1 TsaB [Chitiniphilus eburneus]TJZ78842.1 tRNA (adenosine(37)-N6)-threonylcarbamoyltransferase complex dimerization subunit type 1 TsaB [Chitiniphilus eburneus]